MLRSSFLWVALVVLVGVSRRAEAQVPEDIDIIGRGDSNLDHTVNVSDVVYLNSYLYKGGPAPPCLNNADVNGDGVVNGSDPVFLLDYLYNGGSAPPWPGPNNQTCVVNPEPSPHSCNSGC